MTIATTAEELAGNWRHFDSFAWFGRPEENADDWAIVYLENRDSDALTRANAIVIRKRLAPFLESDTVREERHTHWACGWIDGYAIRVYDADGNVTPVAKEWLAIQEAMENYPALDEDVWAEVERKDEEEAWESWAAEDYRKELIKLHPDREEYLEGLTKDQLSDLFFEAEQVCDVYWEHSDGGAYINTQKLAEATKLGGA